MNRYQRTLAGLLVGFMMGGVPAQVWAGDASLSDQRIVHQVHSVIVADESLPYCAHRVRVDARNGKVILKGKVHSEDVKNTIGEKAATVVGSDAVINDIMVRGS